MAFGLKKKAWIRAWKFYNSHVSDPEGFTIRVEPSGETRPGKEWVAYITDTDAEEDRWGELRHGSSAIDALRRLHSDMWFVWRRKKRERGHEESLPGEYHREYPELPPAV